MSLATDAPKDLGSALGMWPAVSVLAHAATGLRRRI